jgi:hypothetical protein
MDSKYYDLFYANPDLSFDTGNGAERQNEKIYYMKMEPKVFECDDISNVIELFVSFFLCS